MLEQMNRFYEGVVTDRTLELLGLKVLSAGEDRVQLCAGAGLDAKGFSRQCKLLDGYVCLALGGVPDAARPAVLAELAIPGEENELGRAAVWYAMACRSEDPHGVTMAVYNGLGALEGGYPKVTELAQTWLGDQCAPFLAGVQAARWDEDDAGNATGPEPGVEVWKALDLDALRAGLLKAIRARQ